MRSMAGMALLVAVMVSWHSPGGAAEVTASSQAKSAGDGSGALAWDLVRAAGSGNVVVSPVSVWEALAMTHQAARGETATEIAGVLGMPDDRSAIAAAAEGLRASLAEAKGDAITLNAANRLWLQKGKSLQGEFTSALEKRFGAKAGEVPFSSAPEAARGEINTWVADHTAGKIAELLKAGVITPLTRLVLTNAVYLKAPWAEPFAKSATKPATFQLAPGESIDVPFMHCSELLVAGRVGAGDEAATVCEIPYAGHRLSMVVMVPERVDGLDAVLGTLDGDWRAKWTGRGDGDVRPRKVVLALPKWTARKPLGLSSALKSLGMKRAFEAGAADLSGIDGTRDLFVSDVVHEAFVDVSEEGTEAAAATGVVMGVRSMAPQREEPLVVKADRPFAWAVIERGTGAVVFAGVVADPRY
ncbi:MAG: serpin family protein [Pirellulales bacterium]